MKIQDLEIYKALIACDGVIWEGRLSVKTYSSPEDGFKFDGNIALMLTNFFLKGVVKKEDGSYFNEDSGYNFSLFKAVKLNI